MGAKRKFHVSPDFNRLPIRPPEQAVYRDCVPPSASNNPLYRALPGPRRPSDIKAIVEAGNPQFDPGIRSLGPMERKEYIDEVNRVLVAIPQHAALEELVMSTIRQASLSYPLTARFLEDTVRVGAEGERPRPDFRRSVGAGAIFGAVGSGKTESLVQLLMACPQTIKHSEFKGRHLGFIQIAWLYISMPPKASAFGFLLAIAGVLDRILGTSYWQDVIITRNHAEATAMVAGYLNLNAVGVVFADELQNIKVGSSTERDLLENTIQELVNLTHTRFVFIGTNESRRAVNSEALLRRMVGERGQITWSPLEEGPDWNDFVGRIWQWQVTAFPTPMTPSLSSLLHRLTGGVPDYAKKLFTATQATVIGNSSFPKEQLTDEQFVRVMKARFPDVHRKLERRFRKDNPSASDFS